jgi:predicted nucleic acid-binding protein
MTRRVYLDTCCIIYLIEDVPGFSVPMRPHLARHGDAILSVSPRVRLEVLIKPLVNGDQALERDYEDFLAAQQWLSMGDAEFDRATRLRAIHGLKTPDALHLATATRNGCAEFWTNDDRLNNAAADMAVNIFAAATSGAVTSTPAQ